VTRHPAPTEYRTEHDTMGEVLVPADALWRAQTQRAVENFPISGQRIDPAIVTALARIKGAAATVNGDLGVLEADTAAAIAAAAATVADGGLDDQFPVDVYQTGSGTSTNMNVNEVLATLASRSLRRDVHPNDHVNAGQSSNDTFPSALHLAAASEVTGTTLPGLRVLESSLAAKAVELADAVTAGRTHLMDATPVTLGQRFSGYAAQVRAAIEGIDAAVPRLLQIPLGGTAVGTGLNAEAGFAASVVALLAEQTGMDVQEAPNHMAGNASRDALVETSAALRTAAVALTKVCNDLRWMGSGPRAGLGEIVLPDLQPGSSIMPGKVNPVLPEATLMVCARVVGNDATIAWSGASGSFELNVAMPVMGQALVESARLLGRSADVLARRCVDGIVADTGHARSLAEGSPAIVTPLNRYLGYERAAAVAKTALAQRRSIRDVVLDAGFIERGLLSTEQLDAALDVLAMAQGPAAPALAPAPPDPAAAPTAEGPPTSP
jgi:fumarate hydratase class II